MKPDIEYENAIRYYLDNIFLNPDTETDKEFADFNTEKTLTKYIAQNAPKGFRFSTPMFAWWDLTSACNFRCIHCLYNDTPYDSSNDLTDEEAEALADSLIEDFKIVQIVLTGGEIFLRPALLMRLISKFRSANIGVVMATNAALINDKHIEFLAEHLNRWTDRIQISLDGATSETFAKIRRTNTFDKITANIEKLTLKGLRVTVACTVNSLNYNEIIDTYRLCEKLGVTEFGAGKMLYYNESHKPLMVNNRDLMILAKKLLDEKTGKKTQLNLSLFNNMELINIEEVENILREEKYRTVIESGFSRSYRSCNRNDRISIKSDGRIYMCLEAECPNALMGNIRENSLPEIWAKRESNIFFQPRLIENMGCKDCNYKSVCNSGCMVKAYKRTGSVNSPEINCKFCMTL